MASLFYNRYVPPPAAPVSSVSYEQGLRKIAKRRTSSSRKSRRTIDTQEIFSESQGQLSSVKPSSAEDESASQPGAKSPERHDTILAKYRHSTSQNGQQEQNNHHDAQPAGEISISAKGLQPLPQSPLISTTQSRPLPPVRPSWTLDRIIVGEEKRAFPDCRLHLALQSSLERVGYVEATPVQAQILRLVDDGLASYDRDLCIQAPTGSGKTLAYVLPMIQALLDSHGPFLRGLIVLPSSALVAQVKAVIESLIDGTHLHVGSITGERPRKVEAQAILESQSRYDPEAYEAQNKDADEEEALLAWDDSGLDEASNSPWRKGYVTYHYSKIQILVCTPWSLVQHVQETQGFTLQDIKWLVLDELDQLVNRSFKRWVDIVMPLVNRPYVPFEPHDRIQKVLLSATMERDLVQLESLFSLHRPLLFTSKATESLDGVDGHKSTDRAEDDPQPAATLVSKNITLPKSLSEYAYKIADVEEKPLHLYKLLVELMQSDPSQNLTLAAKTSRNLDRQNDEEQANHPSSASSSTSSLSSSTASDSESQDLEHKRMHPAKRAKNGKSTTSGTKAAILVFTSASSTTHRLAHLCHLLDPNLTSQIKPLTALTARAHRQRLLRQFQHEKFQVLISTDLLAHGIDFAHLTHVINYDMPRSMEEYVHRVGRTARSGRAGSAITLIEHKQARWFWRTMTEIERPLIQRVHKMRLVSMDAAERENYAFAITQIAAETGRVDSK